MRLHYYNYSFTRGLQKIKTKTAILLTAFSLVVGGSGASLALLGSAHAANNFSLFGSASQQADGVHLVSNGTNPFSGITLKLPAGTTVNNISDLEASFQVDVGTCGLGAPRFSVVTPAHNVFVYMGDYPNYSSCSGGATGNLLLGPDKRVDTSQAGGTFYDTWTDAQTLVGSQTITELDIVVDGGSAIAPQEFTFTSATINGTVYNFVPAPTKDSCKNGGWQKFTSPGPFKNQGDCVSYFATNGKNPPNGT